MNNQNTLLRWGSVLKEKGWDGLNNAAINSFNSNVINSFVREIIQNSNDARRKDPETKERLPLRIVINYKSVSTSDLLYLNQFKDIFHSISEAPSNKQHEQFFKNGFEAIQDKQKIKLFVYEDFNTTGLSGNDDDPECTFNSCILSEGTSVKPDDSAGGSYGIGKNSIYGFSKVRTVFYSSLNQDGEFIFQGLGKLASYKVENQVFDSRVYFGTGEKLNSIRKLEDLPSTLRELFKRTEYGLSQFALCPIENENWIDEFVKAILRNYWPLLHNDELFVELKEDDQLKQTVTKSDLDNLMMRFFDPKNYAPGDTSQEGNPYDFYSCYLSQAPEQKEIHALEKVSFFYKELEHKNTNRIAYLRNGMVIQTKPVWGFGSIAYCGVFICNSKAGNTFLRMMEPHTHDRFDPSRINDKTDKFTIKDGEKSLKEMDQLIRGCLTSILNKYRKKAEDIPWLNNLLSSLKGFKGNGTGNRTGIKSDKETRERISSELRYNLKFATIEKNKTLTFKTGEIVDIGGGQKGLGPVTPRSKNNPPGPIGTKAKKTNKIEFQSRIFRTKIDDRISTYKIILNAEKNFEDISLMLFQIGDSGNTVSFEIVEVITQEKRIINFSEVKNKQNVITAYRLNGLKIPDILEIKLKEPHKSVFKLQEL